LEPTEDDDSDPTAVCITTSGSTGAAKSVLLPAGALLASAAATHDRLGGAGHWLLALPSHHVAGLQVLVRSLVGGTRPAVAEPGQFTPSRFVAAAEEMPATRARYTSLVPTQLVRLLSDARAIAALRTFRAVLVGGAGVPSAVLAKAHDAGIAVVTTYGMSETCGGCVYDERPLDGVEVRLDEGRVLLGGPVLARGYLADDAGTASNFVERDGKRWFRTDDAGQFRFGRLRVLGRLDDMIVSGGVNVAPAPIEGLLQEWPQVREACVVGVPDPQWGQRVAAALVLIAGLAVPPLAEVRTRIRASLGPASAPRQLTVLPELPLRGPGKPDRAAIAAVLAKDPAWLGGSDVEGP
jgi:O-succinylbenzoic acid--CoA ligase